MVVDSLDDIRVLVREVAFVSKLQVAAFEQRGIQSHSEEGKGLTMPLSTYIGDLCFLTLILSVLW